MQRVDQTRRTDHRRAVLIVMKDRDIHLFLEALFNDETFRRLDVLKVDTAKRRTHQFACVNERLGVLGIQFDINRVHVGKAFEQNRLAFHHRLGCQCP